MARFSPGQLVVANLLAEARYLIVSDVMPSLHSVQQTVCGGALRNGAVEIVGVDGLLRIDALTTGAEVIAHGAAFMEVPLAAIRPPPVRAELFRRLFGGQIVVDGLLANVVDPVVVATATGHIVPPSDFRVPEFA